MSYRTNDPLGTISGDLTGNEATATVISITGESGTVNISSSGNIITWNKATASPGITQSTPTSDVATQNITITSQAPYASASTNKNPGNILLNVPSPVSGGNSGFVEFQQGGSTIVAIGELVGGSNPAIYLQSAPSSSNWSLQQSGTAFNINSAGTVNTYIGGSQLCLQVSSSAITSSLGTIEWSSSSTLPTLTQITPSSDVAVANLTIQSQAPYASASAHQTPGNIVLNTPSPISSASPGFVQIQSGGTNYLQAGQLSNGSSYAGLWMGNVSPSSSNYTIASNNTDTILSSTSITSLAVSGTNYLAVSSSYVQLVAPALEWAATVSSPSVSQLTQTSDAATHNLTIQAQSAYTSASSNTSGANLILEGGLSKTAGTGVGGNVSLASGLLQKTYTVTASTYTCDTNAQTSDLVLLCNRAGTITLTLPAVSAGRTVYVKDASGAAGTNHITITPASGTVDGASTYVLSGNYDGVMLVSDGTNWFVVGEYNGTII